VVEATAIDIWDVPDPGAAIVAGLKVTVTPLGWPEADNPIAVSNPPETAVVIVDVPLEPSATESEAGEGVTEKPVVTVKVTLAVCVMPPPVPETVIV
jgi:hypothetical protein